MTPTLAESCIPDTLSLRSDVRRRKYTGMQAWNKPARARGKRLLGGGATRASRGQGGGPSRRRQRPARSDRFHARACTPGLLRAKERKVPKNKVIPIDEAMSHVKSE